MTEYFWERPNNGLRTGPFGIEAQTTCPKCGQAPNLSTNDGNLNRGCGTCRIIWHTCLGAQTRIGYKHSCESCGNQRFKDMFRENTITRPPTGGGIARPGRRRTDDWVEVCDNCGRERCKGDCCAPGECPCFSPDDI